MEALVACYGDGSSDSDSDSQSSSLLNQTLAYSEGRAPLPPRATQVCVQPLPPPPVELLHPPNFLGPQDMQIRQTNKVRSFPHVDGNYALHVYIPINIPSPSKKDISAFLKKISSQEPSLHVVDVDVPLNVLCKNDEKLEQVALGREFHISLGRTVPIRVHQIDSVVSMLRQKLQTQQKSYWIDFHNWEVFVNDDRTRTFLSVEVVHSGLVEIQKQIEAVNTIYKLHNLPEFYEDPRPHISLAWSLGDTSDSLKKIVGEEMKKCVTGKSLKKCVFTCKFKDIECKIGNKTYIICKVSGR
ncbi:uncharacterized protein LOC131594797 isoform X1 [Vicia villosa]|uniref:uncharacterized protein LOC131594797 isoform X1 n=2 Tax=Vicia villosa TaxID=3911 RepID=UPI00273ACB83|nr:uncharacterized protein LOC131594797 isoform X1 [Vicia villosa]XP_058722980.1 uncharacterized protein LOC131594797 isoform X1 [Vicia villosa]